MTNCLACNILSWKNTATSAAVLGSFNLCYLLLFVFSKTLVSVLSIVLLCVLAVGSVFKLLDVTQVAGDDVEIVSKQIVNEYLLLIYDHTNDYFSTLRDIIFWKEAELSLKAAGVLLAIACIGSLVSLPTLIFLTVWSAFLFTFTKELYFSVFHPIVQPQFSLFYSVCCNVVSMIPRMDDFKKEL